MLSFLVSQYMSFLFFGPCLIPFELLAVGSNVALCWNWSCYSLDGWLLSSSAIILFFLVVTVEHTECICVFILFKHFMFYESVPGC